MEGTLEESRLLEEWQSLVDSPQEPMANVFRSFEIGEEKSGSDRTLLGRK
ncbi:unnamed protein product [Calypogeia fissa]